MLTLQFCIFKIYSGRELEETLNKIREILSDDKHDWDQRANAVSFLFSYPSLFFNLPFQKHGNSIVLLSGILDTYEIESLISDISFWKVHRDSWHF